MIATRSTTAVPIHNKAVNPLHSRPPIITSAHWWPSPLAWDASNASDNRYGYSYVTMSSSRVHNSAREQTDYHGARRRINTPVPVARVDTQLSRARAAVGARIMDPKTLGKIMEGWDHFVPVDVKGPSPASAPEGEVKDSLLDDDDWCFTPLKPAPRRRRQRVVYSDDEQRESDNRTSPTDNDGLLRFPF